MLILTRKVGESITIGDDIRVTVIGLKGQQVKLGIEAPAHTKVHRAEIYTRILEENRHAAEVSTEDAVTMRELWRQQAVHRES